MGQRNARFTAWKRAEVEKKLRIERGEKTGTSTQRSIGGPSPSDASAVPSYSYSVRPSTETRDSTLHTRRPTTTTTTTTTTTPSSALGYTARQERAL